MVAVIVVQACGQGRLVRLHQIIIPGLARKILVVGTRPFSTAALSRQSYILVQLHFMGS